MEVSPHPGTSLPFTVADSSTLTDVVPTATIRLPSSLALLIISAASGVTS